MIDFQYAGLTADGKPCQGSVRAPDAQTARLRLIGQGVTPVHISAAAGEPSSAAPQRRGARLKRAEVLLFSREMAHLKRANMPLDKALAMLRETADTQRLRAFLAKVEEGVRGGKSLYQSLLPFERDLGRQYLVLIRAAEASGALPAVLKELTEQLEAQDKLRNYIISTLTYPLILLIVAVLSVLLLLAFVVPQFREIFDSMGDALPYSTRLVVDLSDLVRAHWMALLLGLATLLLLGSRWAATPPGRLRLDQLLLGLPLFGRVMRNLQFATYFRTLGILLQRGVPLVDALRIALDTLTNAVLRKDMAPLVDTVKAGKRLSSGITSPHLGKSSTPQLIRVAEETGQLDSTLLGLADRYEDEGRRSMARVLAAMEPLIIIVLGALVAFIIIAILGGVLSINDTL
ncbi:type II secretion system F family protein [Verminephrobacter aporrectodeae subsp. tuberculatae]|uniref:type II secretion system F family protein n=1 Tax=Verminephrobacter aporrectodeae TaxID=1110389 RepID=UPI002237AB51|nr:type II secretion system F family protein [Verminephrobacter aporrectodeae]MCW5222514.1 type II secretion system F family protein [Verminephrobacter aporrectodeae subsp. tuberculatae]MCW5257277.1 type II secretion system F family protein [Verminephrobacter aporrectodeae subsp. tuberculatae]MCW5287979.1 type II secretion system F family protein [Verminephrobacter aporrectodeae subsp. tuberculatae]MCW8166894.1 type II secretion system F family protein [Verminephrobacter aporrectodeae subsp. tu